jgi:predicted aspartyl protease
MTAQSFARGLCALAALLATTGARADDARPRCEYTQLAELPLYYTGTSLQVTTNGTINGKPAIMLVDTGASSVSLTRPLVERLDLQLNMTGQYSEGFGGLSRIYSARLDEFAVGPAKSARGWFRVISDTGATPQFDAIAGAPFLLQADMELALAEKKMRFFRGKNCQNAFLGYWGGDIFEIPFTSRMDDRSRNPHFTIEVNGKEMDAVIDSGSSTSSIMASAAKRAGLKLDAPGSERLGTVVGVGSDKVDHWSAVVETLRIGGEVIHDARIGVMETEAIADVFLGDDYLRAHRVLFAMGRRKLYISYLGGDPFKQRTSIEPWMLQEAESGNADAQYVLSNYYRAGRGVPKDLALADSWLRKAAAAGHPQANLQYGFALLAAHHPGEAVPRLRLALDKLPNERFGALSLYLARLQTGEPDLGKRELETAFARGERDDWPAPIAQFYLGRIDSAALLEAARKDNKLAQERTCSATSLMAALYEAKGDKANADAMRASRQAACKPAANGKSS